MSKRTRVSSIRKYATREMYARKNCSHAIYGIAYTTPQGTTIEELADTPDKIIYFPNDLKFDNFVEKIHNKYDDFLSIDVYAVHRHKNPDKMLATRMEHSALK